MQEFKKHSGENGVERFQFFNAQAERVAVGQDGVLGNVPHTNPTSVPTVEALRYFPPWFAQSRVDLLKRE